MCVEPLWVPFANLSKNVMILYIRNIDVFMFFFKLLDKMEGKRVAERVTKDREALILISISSDSIRFC